MSHQTGIQANDVLKKVFSKSRSGRIRLIKISIEKEELTLSTYKEKKDTWEKDFDKMVLSLIEPDQPCYVLFRLDSINELGFEWLLISWCPDSAAVRQKMLYASTKATLKTEFGSSYIKNELHTTVLEEVSCAGYKKHLNALGSPAPLTNRETELQEIRRTETNIDINTDTRHLNLGGVSFPMTEQAIHAIQEMVQGSYNYVQFLLDLDKEIIHVVKAANIQLEQLPKQVPIDSARYHLYMFKHSHEGDYTESVVFIYSMPGYSLPIRERMLYSSCKAPFINDIQTLGLVIAKKLEIDHGNELTEQFLMDELHPKRNLHRPLFSKPKGPPNRGAKRLTKPN